MLESFLGYVIVPSYIYQFLHGSNRGKTPIGVVFYTQTQTASQASIFDVELRVYLLVVQTGN